MDNNLGPCDIGEVIFCFPVSTWSQTIYYSSTNGKTKTISKYEKVGNYLGPLEDGEVIFFFPASTKSQKIS